MAGNQCQGEREFIAVNQISGGLLGTLLGTAVANEIQSFAWMNGQATAKVDDVHSCLNKKIGKRGACRFTRHE
jgi:hypothetical protein